MKIGDLPKAVRVQNAFSVFEHALTVGRHWLDQEGVNAAYLDALAEAVKRYDEEAPPEPFVVDTTDARESDEYRKGYKEGSDDTARELLGGREREDRLRDAMAALSADLRRRPLLRYPESRCDGCDPSFGCFSKPELCCKKVSPP